jgi:hypothetical protein
MLINDRRLRNMETVYIIGILATVVVILGVVWLLRDRITSGRFGASASEQKIEAELKAASPPSKPSSSSIQEKPSSVEISGNWMIGANVIRVLRDSVRVARNRLFGKQRIEVKKDLPKATLETEEPEAKKRKK